MPAEPGLSPGHVLNRRYKITQLLGRGAFGQTYLAEDTYLSDAVQYVVKQFRPQHTDPHTLETAKRLFDREATTLKNLPEHPQVPQFFDRFDEGGEFYLVQEFISGTNLGREMVSGEPWDESRVIRLLDDVLNALEFLHQRGVIHRDIKPANLIRRESNNRSENKIVLIDFGSVKEVSNIDADGRPPTQIATPGYSTLEQSNGILDPSNDLYALGMTAIEALTGVLARQLRDFNQRVIWHPHLQGEGCSPELKQILDRMVHPQFERRYRSATEVLRDLRPLTVVPLTGITLDERYELVEFLGGSEYRQAYKALYLRSSSSKPCIIRRIIPDSHLGSLAQQLFAIEYTRLRRLGEYPQIASQLDEFESEGDFYIVREYIEGTPLDRELASGRRQTERQVRLLLQEILQILRCFHQAGMVHGNIQPSQFIRRTSDSKLVLVGFGAVREPQLSPISSSQGNRYLPDAGGILHADTSTDIYAAGSIAIHALTGVYPDELQDPYNPKASWHNKLLNLNPKLATILDKMVHPDFRLRYQLVEDVLQKLNRSFWWRIFRIGAFGIGAGSLLLVLSVFLFASTRSNSVTRQCEALAESDRLAEDQLDTALKVCETATLQKPKSGILWNYLGDVYFRRNEWSDALRAYERAEKVEPNNPNFLADIGDTLSLLNRDREALEAYETAIELDQSNPTAWNGKGTVLIGVGDNRNALDAFDAAITLDRNDPKSHQNRGLALKNLGRLDESRQAYEAALAIYEEQISTHSQNLDAWIGKGEVLNQLQRHQEAKEAFDEALAINPNSFPAFSKQANSLFFLGEYDEALEQIEKAIQHAPSSLTHIIWTTKGSFHTDRIREDGDKSSDYREAIEAYEEALKAKREFVPAIQGLGMVFLYQEKYREAISQFDRAIALKDNKPQFWVLRGVALAQMKSWGLAQASIEKGLELNPQDALAWYQLGQVQENLDREAEAIASYDRALEINPGLLPAKEARRRLLANLR